MPPGMLMRCPECKGLVIYGKTCRCGKTTNIDEEKKDG